MVSNRPGFIYLTINEITGKMYVGLHTGNKPGYLGSGRYIQNAIKKYGRENFSRQIIDEFSEIEEGCAKERFWIEHLNTRVPFGYNLTAGGDGLFNPTPEVREKIRQGRIGYKMSPESIAKMVASKRSRPHKTTKGRKASAETRERLRLSHLGYKNTEETRKKKSISATKAWAIRKNSQGGVPLSTPAN